MSENTPLRNKDEIQRNPDNKIDQDFQGYPQGPAKDETIHPRTETEEKAADMNNKDGEKRDIKPGERQSLDEQESDGSANAFEEK
jgi:hypothetical protein